MAGGRQTRTTRISDWPPGQDWPQGQWQGRQAAVTGRLARAGRQTLVTGQWPPGQDWADWMKFFFFANIFTLFADFLHFFANTPINFAINPFTLANAIFRLSPTIHRDLGPQTRDSVTLTTNLKRPVPLCATLLALFATTAYSYRKGAHVCHCSLFIVATACICNPGPVGFRDASEPPATGPPEEPLADEKSKHATHGPRVAGHPKGQTQIKMICVLL